LGVERKIVKGHAASQFIGIQKNKVMDIKPGSIRILSEDVGRLRRNVNLTHVGGGKLLSDD
jgi:hypothetical protein